MKNIDDIYDTKGNLIGHKVRSFPSGDTICVYPQRLKDNIETAEKECWRKKATSGGYSGGGF